MMANEHTQLLTDGTIRLRALEPTDLDMVEQWENDTRLWTVTDTQAPYSRQMIWQYLKTYNGDIYASHCLRLVITLAQSGQAVGLLDFEHFSAFNNRCEIGLLVAGQFVGCGYGHRAVAIAMRYAAEHLGLRQAYVVVRTDNESCLRVFEDNGFEHSGLLKQWIKRGKQYHDALILQRLL